MAALSNAALFHAAKGDHTAVVSMLLRAGADPAARSNYAPALRRLRGEKVKVSKERVQAFFGIETAKARGGAPRIALIFYVLIFQENRFW